MKGVHVNRKSDSTALASGYCCGLERYLLHGV